MTPRLLGPRDGAYVRDLCVERPRGRVAPDFCCKKTTLQKIVLLFCEKVIHRFRSKKSYPQHKQTLILTRPTIRI